MLFKSIFDLNLFLICILAIIWFDTLLFLRVHMFGFNSIPDFHLKIFMLIFKHYIFLITTDFLLIAFFFIFFFIFFSCLGFIFRVCFDFDLIELFHTLSEIYKIKCKFQHAHNNKTTQHYNNIHTITHLLNSSNTLTHGQIMTKYQQTKN